MSRFLTAVLIYTSLRTIFANVDCLWLHIGYCFHCLVPPHNAVTVGDGQVEAGSPYTRQVLACKLTFSYRWYGTGVIEWLRCNDRCDPECLMNRGPIVVGLIVGAGYCLRINNHILINKDLIYIVIFRNKIVLWASFCKTLINI